jgi:putative hydrolases of HD superfamily
MNSIAKYLYEMGQLKRVKRSGWWMAGITDPESVAEHSFRTAILGYILASLEGVGPQKTATMCLFHDTQEARVNDLHKVAQRYIDLYKSESQALAEQVERLPEGIAQEVLALMGDYEHAESLEARVAHDADRLECLVQAREYQAQGYADVQDWIDGCRASLKTEAARNLADACLQVEPSAWWQGLKKLTDDK